VWGNLRVWDFKIIIYNNKNIQKIMALKAGASPHEKLPVQKGPLRVLILTKKNSEYGGEVDFKSGLNNTALFLAEELEQNLHISAKFVACTDGNSVDREISLYKPTHVILEAIWVTPAKLIEVQKLWPYVVFVIRIHSKITFLAYEGNAIEWIKAYEQVFNTYISFNSEETYEDFKTFMNPDDLVWLPNIYKKIDHSKTDYAAKAKTTPILNIACFGAIRPMKDILLQAVAAMNYCNGKALQLWFHVNSGRTEQRGDSTLHNLRALFAGTKHSLVEHGWLTHEDFVELIKTIDLGMQVSLNESFNVVTADYVYNLKPVVVSEQIYWVADTCKCESSIESIVAGIARVIDDTGLLAENLELLNKYNQVSLEIWSKFLLATEI
jgi:hypothetical protein